MSSRTISMTLVPDALCLYDGGMVQVMARVMAIFVESQRVWSTLSLVVLVGCSTRIVLVVKATVPVVVTSS